MPPGKPPRPPCRGKLLTASVFSGKSISSKETGDYEGAMKKLNISLLVVGLITSLSHVLKHDILSVGYCAFPTDQYTKTKCDGYCKLLMLSIIVEPFLLFSGELHSAFMFLSLI